MSIPCRDNHVKVLSICITYIVMRPIRFKGEFAEGPASYIRCNLCETYGHAGMDIYDYGDYFACSNIFT